MAPPNILGRDLTILYSKQDVTSVNTYGTAVAPATSLGLARWNQRKSADMRSYRAPGSKNLIVRKEGMASVPFDVDIDVQDFTFLKLATRTGGEATGRLPWITMGFGWNGAAGHTADQVRDCKLHTINLRLTAGETGGVLTARVTGTGGVVSAINTLVQSYLAPLPFHYYDLVVTRGGSAWDCRELTLDLNHNVRVGSRLRGAQRTSGEERFWDYQDEMEEGITGSLVRHELSSIPFLSGFQTPTDVVLTLTDVADNSHTEAITLGLVTFGEEQRAGTDPNGYLLFTTPFEAKTIAIP